MTEQVIDIRDRIEKMRDQMTVPGSQKAMKANKPEIASTKPMTFNSGDKDLHKDEKLAVFQEINDENKSEPSKSQSINLKNKEEAKTKSSENISRRTETNHEPDFIDNQKKEDKLNNQARQNFKTYDDYQKDRVMDASKQSVKLDESQPFPKFSLNVSNPISWKLMLLIMLMQLLTNMMLVVVLYLK